jgi:DNA-binding response OmpR family regulator
MRILLIEPYQPLARALLRGLAEEGFEVDLAVDREQADLQALTGSHDVILFDLALAGELGLLRLAGWRRAGITAPVVLLASPGSGPERPGPPGLAPCFFLSKPFRLEELLTRTRALVRPRSPFAERPLGPTVVNESK